MQAIMGFIMFVIIVLTIIVAILSVAKYMADNSGNYDRAFDLSENISCIGKIALFAVLVEFILLIIFDYNVLLYLYDGIAKNSELAVACFIILLLIAFIAKHYELQTIYLLVSYAFAVLITPIGMLIVITIIALLMDSDCYEPPTKSAEDIIIEMYARDIVEERRILELKEEEERRRFDRLESELRNIRDKL